MQKLGYIVSDTKINGVKGFVEVVNDISLTDKTKPILIVGFEKAKNNIENFNILKKKYGDNLFWTFKKTERRLDFEKDILYFYNYIINNISSNIKYYYINIIKLNYNKLKILYNILLLNNKEKNYIYINDNMLYILYKGDVMGVSLNTLEYCGINPKKVLSKLYKNPNNIICTEVTDCVREIKSEITDNKYVIPYFMSILQ